MEKPEDQAREPMNPSDSYATLLALTTGMRDALVGQDTERFAHLVDRREAVMAAIGQRRPADPAERKCLELTAAIDAEVRESAALTWRRIVGDLQQLRDGKLATAAYFRSMLRTDPEDSSQFIDKTK